MGKILVKFRWSNEKKKQVPKKKTSLEIYGRDFLDNSKTPIKKIFSMVFRLDRGKRQKYWVKTSNSSQFFFRAREILGKNTCKNLNENSISVSKKRIFDTKKRDTLEKYKQFIKIYNHK